MLVSAEDSSAATPPPQAALSLLAATELQDHLLVAHNDLERLQRLLDDAAQALMQHFTYASEHMSAARVHLEACPQGEPPMIREARRTLASAITALQFQDMATQLIAHTSKRLRNCADRLACEAMGDDEDGVALVEEAPLRPNPVTQDEMDAGSIELF
ncbi:MAG: hypothetical protein ABS84_13685 [Rubrivivax sp. SCN 71-131]|jgi:hypothetical protein|nr:MAG: hypothetical protein ABS84_13685 [Rubrivivax sp. SCN 71-131]